jgi:hypothetical protein
LLVLSDLDLILVGRRRVTYLEKIPELFVVDLNECASEDPLILASQLRLDVRACQRKDALDIARLVALDSVSLACTCMSISKDSHIEAFKALVNI